MIFLGGETENPNALQVKGHLNVHGKTILPAKKYSKSNAPSLLVESARIEKAKNRNSQIQSLCVLLSEKITRE